MSEPADQATIAYHYVITVQLPNGTPAMSDGVVTIDLPASRAGLYQWATDKMREKLDTGEFAVMFFDAQPNDITGGAR